MNTDSENFEQHIDYIVKAFGKNDFHSVLDKLELENIDFNIELSSIPSLACIWMEDEKLIEFFDYIYQKGIVISQPQYPINEILTHDKVKTFEYLAKRGIFQSFSENIEDITVHVFVKNNPHLQQTFLNHVDIKQYPLISGNYTGINMIIDWGSEQWFSLLLENKMIDSSIFNSVTYGLLEQKHKQAHFQSFFIESLSEYFALDAQKYLAVKYEKGDISATLKMMHHDYLKQHLVTHPTKRHTHKI